MTATRETSDLTNVREAKDRERRRKKYKFALVYWPEEIGDWESGYTIEHKTMLNHWWRESHEVICDDQPEKVLRAMLKLLEEPKE